MEEYYNSTCAKTFYRLMEDLKLEYDKDKTGAQSANADHKRLLSDFDIAYKNLDEEDETYIKFMETANILTSLDDEDLDSVSIQIRIKNIEACNKIQSTDTLYKLRVNFDYIYDGQAENMTDVIYLSNASGEYKMVYGEWMQTVLNYYQSIYVIKTSYGY